MGVSLYWFALSFFWGSMLVLILPYRVEEIVGPADKDRALGLILASGAAVAGITQILSGAISDIFGSRWGQRRPYLLVGTVCGSAALLFFPAAQTIPSLLAVYIAIQFLLNIAIGPYQALIPDRIPLAYHGRASAFMGVWSLLGRIGGPYVATKFLGNDGGLLKATLLFIVMLNAFMLANVLLIKEPPSPRPHGSVGDHVRNIFDVPLRPYMSFVWIMISRFGIMMGFYTVVSFLLYYIKYTLGVDENDAMKVLSLFMVISTVSGILGVIPAGHFSDRFSKKNVLFVSNGICILAALGFLMSKSLTPAYVAVGFFGVGFGAFMAVDWALGCNLLPEQAKAKYLGIWGLSDTVPQIVAPLIAGPVAYIVNKSEQGLGYRALMVIAIVYYSLGTLALTQVKERRTS